MKNPKAEPYKTSYGQGWCVTVEVDEPTGSDDDRFDIAHFPYYADTPEMTEAHAKQRAETYVAFMRFGERRGGDSLPGTGRIGKA